MTQAFIGTKIVAAWPEEKDGKPGYAVTYPDGYRSWCPQATFETCHRAVTTGEKGLIDQYGAFGQDPQELKLGDQVYRHHEVGKKPLTVNGILPDGQVLCVWNDKQGNPVGGEFHRTHLTLIEQEEITEPEE